MVATSRGAAGARTLRRLSAPRRIELQTSTAGTPSAVRRKGQRLSVVEVLDRYRTDDRWWTDRPVSRTYYELLLEDGRAVTVFRDDLRDTWHEQRNG